MARFLEVTPYRIRATSCIRNVASSMAVEGI